jgi:hypothetical protein
MSIFCEHVYRNMGQNPCPKCGGETHEVNWAIENKLMKEWKLANPDAKSDGWWSI